MHAHRQLLLVSIVIATLLVPPVGGRAHAADADKIDPALRGKLAVDGEASFFVVLKDRADLRAAGTIKDRNALGRFAYEALRQTAATSQGPVIAELQKLGVAHRPFFIANVVHVKAPLDVAERLAKHPGVERIVEERVHPLPPTPRATTGSAASGVGWNVARVGADRVWAAYGATGQDVVVGSIDTGVAFEHPALVRQYRGNLGGSFAHDYSWWDPASICPTAEPCDNNDHGTHTVGTIVGGDGPGPDADDVGVAPGARWIAAKGCEYDFCSESSLLSAAQFMLAPTDLAGNDPDPTLRPHVVNNSWGGGGFDPFFADVVAAWRAAGIFPVFSNGNSGPECGTAGSPADYPESFGVGATDAADVIAEFSSRGASAFGVVKPNVSAPGVNVRSSVPGGGYASFNGTSMAAPHVTGAVALLWSASPSLMRNVDLTATALEASAMDILDASCGGDPSGDPNNVYGAGRIDVLEACLSFCGAHELLTGRIVDSGTGAGIAGVTLEVVRTRDGFELSGATDGDGRYELGLPVPEDGSAESFTVTARAFGYLPQSFAASLRTGVPQVRDLELESLPRHTLSGTVRTTSGGAPIAGTTVRLEGVPVDPVTTDDSGGYAFADLPQGEYRIHAGDGTCVKPKSRLVTVASDKTVNFKLREVTDAFGHRCRNTELLWIDGVDPLPEIVYYPGLATVALPFPFPLYGVEYDTAYVVVHGYVAFQEHFPVLTSSPLPSPTAPNAAIYAFWDQLFPLEGVTTVSTATVGSPPNRIFAIEFENVFQLYDFSVATFEILLFERDGSVVLQWRDLPGFRNDVVGIENEAGTAALQLGKPRRSVARPGRAIRLIPPPLDRDRDGVTDRSDNCPFDANPDQGDGDGDRVGDLCDNCVAIANEEQSDGDADDLGDACDACPEQPDCDRDGYGDGIEALLESHPGELASTPESRLVLGSCLDKVDNDGDGARDLRASGGERACDPDGQALLGHPHQIVLRPFKAKKVTVSAATGRSTRVGEVKVRIDHPLRAEADTARGLPAGLRESVTSVLAASVLDPDLACAAVLVDDPLTGEAEGSAERALVLEPGGRTTLRWLVQLECEPGLAPGRFPETLHVQVRAALPEASGEVLDLVRTEVATIELR